MRKPLVVVSAAASAMVLGGILVATSADADEIPDSPGWAMPDLSSFFGFPADDDSAGFSDFSDSDASDSVDPPDDSDFSGGHGPAAPHQRPAAPDPAADAQDPGRDPVRDPAARPGGQRPHAAAVPQRPAQQRPAQQRALRQRPAQADDDARPAPDAPGFAAARPATALGAAARRDVTASDVSRSVSSPVQQQVLALVNQNRRRYGCDGLSLDRRLIDAANEHAADMARRRYFAHESPNGAGAGDRVRDAGYRWRRYGENIARGADNPYEVVDGWMHSPSHRENILDCRLHQMGVGLAIADDTPYWVQDFATPM
jgi:uncharacterized protein YkwD